jgi:hypothetical protein
MALTRSDHAGFSVDRDSGVVINTDRRELSEYRKLVRRSDEFRALQDEVRALRAEVEELKGSIRGE